MRKRLGFLRGHILAHTPFTQLVNVSPQLSLVLAVFCVSV